MRKLSAAEITEAFVQTTRDEPWQILARHGVSLEEARKLWAVIAAGLEGEEPQVFAGLAFMAGLVVAERYQQVCKGTVA